MDFNNIPNTSSSNKLNIRIDLRLLAAALLIAIIAMLLMWKPWTAADKTDRTVSVTGHATLKAEPDEYVFYPTYEFKNSDKEVALAELTKKNSEIIKKLNELGVADSKIKSDSSGNNYEFYYDPKAGENRYSLRLSVMADNKEFAQKVQDYLVTTAPMGSVSPQATFSDAKRKELESKARDEAAKDARAKADQSARNLGFKVGKVKSIDDGAGFGGIMPYDRGLELSVTTDQKQGLSVQPGENDLRYSLTVVYFVR